MGRQILTVQQRDANLFRIRRLQRECVDLIADWVKPGAPPRVCQAALREAIELLADREGVGVERMRQLISTPVRTL